MHRYLALRFWFSLLLVTAGALLSGCGRKVSDPEALIKRSAVIYVAQENNGQFFVREILKDAAPEKRYRVGQVVTLSLPKIEPRRTPGGAVVVFVHGIGRDAQGTERANQSEIPLYDGVHLALSNLPFDSLIKLIHESESVSEP